MTLQTVIYVIYDFLGLTIDFSYVIRRAHLVALHLCVTCQLHRWPRGRITDVRLSIYFVTACYLLSLLLSTDYYHHFSSSPCLREPTRRQRLGHGSATIIHRILVCSELDDDLASDSERVVDIEVAMRGGRLIVYSDALDVRRGAFGDGAVDGPRVKIFGDDCRADIEVVVVNGVSRSEGGQDKQLRG